MTFRQRQIGRLNLGLTTAPMSVPAVSVGVAFVGTGNGIHVWIQLGRTSRTLTLMGQPKHTPKPASGQKDPFFFWGEGGNA